MEIASWAVADCREHPKLRFRNSFENSRLRKAGYFPSSALRPTNPASATCIRYHRWIGDQLFRQGIEFYLGRVRLLWFLRHGRNLPISLSKLFAIFQFENHYELIFAVRQSHFYSPASIPLSPSVMTSWLKSRLGRARSTWLPAQGLRPREPAPSPSSMASAEAPDPPDPPATHERTDPV